MSELTDIKAVESTDITTFQKIDKEEVKQRIFEIRGFVVMMDSDIADYFGTTTSNLNRAMKRNIKRFPSHFCFQLSREEYREILRFQSGILELGQGKYSKYEPYVYTEQGVAMLTSCLHTDTAISASIQIMEAFVEMTHILRSNQQLLPSSNLLMIEQRTNTERSHLYYGTDYTPLRSIFGQSYMSTLEQDTSLPMRTIKSLLKRYLIE